MRRFVCLALLCASPALAQTTYVRNPPPAASNPLSSGGVVEAPGASMNASGMADQSVSSVKVTPEGRVYVQDAHPNDFSCNLSAGTASAAVCTDLASSTTVVITDIVISNGSTPGSISLNYGTGTACATNPIQFLPVIYLPASSGFIYKPHQPIRVTWASGLDLCAAVTSMNPYSVQIRGYYYQ